ncbi:Hsp90 cochaperone, partial [Spiromyces aspiralis]
ADELKALGNKAFASGQFEDAIKHFTQAIEKDPSNHVLYSNRSAAYASLKDWDKALEDGYKTVEINPTWAKGYGRKGTALLGLGRYEEAREVFNEGLKLDANNAQLKKGLQDAEAGISRQSAGAPFGEMAKAFSGDVLSKIAKNPKLSTFLAQPDYVQKILAIQKDPDQLGTHMQDMRVLQTLFALTGLDVDVTDRPPANSQKSSGAEGFSAEEDYRDEEEERRRIEKEKEEEEKRKKQKEKEEEEAAAMPREMTEEEKKKVEAQNEKAQGNEAYKKRDFETALAHYDRAIELDPYDITYYNNKAAVYFEMGDYDKCIEIEKEAIKIKFEHPTDYKLVAKAYGRMGSAYLKKDDLDNAIEYFNKSLTEQRSPDIFTKLRETEKLKKRREEEAYIDEGKAEEARERGNTLFKENKFAEAVKEYTEAIKRSPKDPRNYSNRAACFTKLFAIPDAIKDCNKSIELDPTFIKAYLRKANIEVLKKDYAEAIEICEEAMEKDTDGKHRAEIEAQIATCYSAISAANINVTPQEAMKRAQQNPEIQKILADPGMQVILQQMQSDPNAVKEHMKNKDVAKNLRRLWAAGIVRMG